MFCATSVLKQPPARIGRIGKSITLPRTVPVVTLAATVAGGLVAMGAMVVFTTSLTSLVMSAVVGGMAGWVAVSYSPLRGESLARWLGLKVKASAGRVEVNGQMTRVYIGVAPAHRVAAGKLSCEPGAIEVHPGSVDDEGRFADADAMNAAKKRRSGTRKGTSDSLRKEVHKASKRASRKQRTRTSAARNSSRKEQKI